MMPFALDLISTFVVGSILPVATTDLTIVPVSAVTTLLGIDFRRGAFEAGETGHGADATTDGDDGDIQTFSRPFCGCHTSCLTSS